MTSPVADSYRCASGGVIAGGRFNANSYAALIGDSLTAAGYGLTPFYTGNGANGGKLKLLANCGVSGETVADILSRVNNLYTAGSPGFAGIAASVGESSIGYAVSRVGTNDIRGGGAFPTTAATSLCNALATYAKRVIILSVPPVSNVAGNTSSIAANSWLAAFAAANPGRFMFVNDSLGLRNPDGSQIASYFVDDVHLNHKGVAVCGAALASALAAELAGKPSPLITDPTDIYPAHPQWVINPFMAGSGGSVGGSVTGVVANNTGVTGYNMTAVCSKVAADIGDANQTPWQRVAISAATSGQHLNTGIALQGRAMSSIDPAQFDVSAEIRLNAVNTTQISNVSTYIQANTTEFISPQVSIDFEPSASLSKTYVLRNTTKRTGGTTPTSLNFLIIYTIASTFTGGIGSIDFRRVSVRG